MIELIIAFLISLGWLTGNPKTDHVIVDDLGGNRYGVVSTDDVGTRSVIINYDASTGTFKLQQ